MKSLIRISGIIGGPIWQPGFTCSKHFSVNQSPRLADLSDMLEHITNDGDFQHCRIADATVSVTRMRRSGTSAYSVTREWDIRQFPSAAAYLVNDDSEEYWAIIDASQGVYEETD